MLRVGLTGGIAAGKSAVARRFAELGAVVVDADLLAREVLEPGSPGLEDVVSAFGPEVLGADGALDRPALGRLVFADAGARERLNAIVHPRVRARATALVDGAPEDAIVVEDIPLLVETGQAARFHLVVVVDAPDEVRIERMVVQRGMDPEDAGRRIAAQASRAERLREADAVLPNDRGLDDLLAEVDALWGRRIVPFRDALSTGERGVAGVAGPVGAGVAKTGFAGAGFAGTGFAGTGLAGTGGLTRRLRAKLAAALPPGASVRPDADPDRREDGDDVAGARLRVRVAPDADPATVPEALAAAGFLRVPDAGRDREDADGRVQGVPTVPAVYRAADPAIDATVDVT